MRVNAAILIEQIGVRYTQGRLKLACQGLPGTCNFGNVFSVWSFCLRFVFGRFSSEAHAGASGDRAHRDLECPTVLDR